MSFDKNYQNRKDRREQYRRSKAIDRSCRNGGSCPICSGNRQVRKKRGPKLSDWDQSA